MPCLNLAADRAWPDTMRRRRERQRACDSPSSAEAASHIADIAHARSSERAQPHFHPPMHQSERLPESVSRANNIELECPPERRGSCIAFKQPTSGTFILSPSISLRMREPIAAAMRPACAIVYQIAAKCMLRVRASSELHTVGFWLKKARRELFLVNSPLLSIRDKEQKVQLTVSCVWQEENTLWPGWPGSNGLPNPPQAQKLSPPIGRAYRPIHAIYSVQ
jgi:hypothetical protein